MFAALPTHGEASGLVSARTEAALHAIANGNVFDLHLMAYLDALANVWHFRFGGVAEVKIENHFAAIHRERDYEIRIEVAFVPVQHEIRILPEIVGAIAFACGGRIRFGGAVDSDRARLHAPAINILNRVVRVIENAVQSLVHVRHVVSAVEKIVDVNFPVAIESVTAAL